jgi:hypothetical protein
MLKKDNNLSNSMEQNRSTEAAISSADLKILSILWNWMVHLNVVTRAGHLHPAR